MPRPATGVTPKRQIRIGDAVWDPAIERARAEGRSLAKVVTEFLATYGAQAHPEAGSVDPWDVVNLVVREATAGRVGPSTDLEAAVAAAVELLRALGITPALPSTGHTPLDTAPG
jgi:hypothetical protein